MHCRKLAYTASPPNMVCVTTLPRKIWITTLHMLDLLVHSKYEKCVLWIR